MYKSNMAENPEKQIAWICRLDQYPPIILNPKTVFPARRGWGAYAPPLLLIYALKEPY